MIMQSCHQKKGHQSRIMASGFQLMISRGNNSDNHQPLLQVNARSLRLHTVVFECLQIVRPSFTLAWWNMHFAAPLFGGNVL